MLFIDGKKAFVVSYGSLRSISHNAEVEASGVGEKWEVRKTDLDEGLPTYGIKHLRSRHMIHSLICVNCFITTSLMLMVL